MTTGNPAFCLLLNLTGVHFRGELQHVGDVSEQKSKYGPIRTREVTDVKLLHKLYAKICFHLPKCSLCFLSV